MPYCLQTPRSTHLQVIMRFKGIRSDRLASIKHTHEVPQFPMGHVVVCQTSFGMHAFRYKKLYPVNWPSTSRPGASWPFDAK